MCLPRLTSNASSLPADSSRMCQQLRGMRVYPCLTNKRLIFASKWLKDASTTQGDVYLPPPDQQCLIFTSKQLEDVSIPQGEAYLLLINNASSLLANTSRTH